MTTLQAMARILVVTDEQWVRNQAQAALSVEGVEIVDHADPSTAAQRAIDDDVDVLVVDLQVGTMGGMAVTRDVRHIEPTAGALPVVLLLDRAADRFLAGRAGADAWVTKPFTAGTLRGAIAAVTSSEES